MSQPLIALCVGHSRWISGRRDGGAVSAGGISEWAYNRDLALRIHQLLASMGIAAFVEDDYAGSGYTAAMQRLASYLRSRNTTHAVELHFNAANKTARGHEWLYWRGSSRGEALARSLSFAYSAADIGTPARGVKARGPGDRGAEFLRLTHCPAVIAEPFFGDNPADWKLAAERRNDIARAIANGIADVVSPSSP